MGKKDVQISELRGEVLALERKLDVANQLLENYLRFQHVTAMVVEQLVDDQFVGGPQVNETYNAVVFMGTTVKLIVIPSEEKLIVEGIKNPEIRREIIARDARLVPNEVNALVATAAMAKRAAKRGGTAFPLDAPVDLLDRAPVPEPVVLPIH